MAYRFSDFSTLTLVLTILGLVLAHATNNMLNDYVDFQKGIGHNKPALMFYKIEKLFSICSLHRSL